MIDKNETLTDFMKRNGYEEGAANSIEEHVYWSSVFTYEKKWNWRRQVFRIKKLMAAYKELGKKENMLKNKFHKALSEILIEDNELTHCFDTSKILGWPNVPNVEDGDANPAGPLDMENCGYISLTDTEFTMVCGGDWQTAHEVVIVMGVEGLEVAGVQEWAFDNTSEEFEEELSNKLFVIKYM
jgi:hypothetical protein|tara:strand:- start:1379 stop:1930 length:552 start_codon:yes stop_codon:yes gene_type:complete